MSRFTFIYAGGKTPGSVRKVVVDEKDGGKITPTLIVGRDETRGNEFRSFDRSKITEMFDMPT